MNPQQHFFQSFFGPGGMPGMPMQEAPMPIPEYITQNEAIMEIINNWLHIKDLIKKYKEGKINQPDAWDGSWINFIMNNGINIDLYNDSAEFQRAYWRIPTQ